MILVPCRNLIAARSQLSQCFNFSRSHFWAKPAQCSFAAPLLRRHFARPPSRSTADHIVQKPDDTAVTLEEAGVVKCTKDQWLYRPTAREIRLFLDSKTIPTRPIDLENSVVVRLVDLKDSVSSPVRSTVYFSEYGVRGRERVKLFVIWALFTSACVYLGVWQLRRRKWKEALIESRQRSLSLDKLSISSLSDLKRLLTADTDLDYRVVEAKGVLDTKTQFFVGPRQPLTHEHGSHAGFYVLHPLRFEDGSSILVNMGWLKSDEVFDMRVSPEWVTVRGVLAPGEISENVVPALKFRFLTRLERLVRALTNREVQLASRVNRASRLMRNDDRTVYRYLDPEAIGAALFSTEPALTQRYILNAYDSYFDEDRPDVEPDRPRPSVIDRIVEMSGIRPLAAAEPSRAGPNRYKFQRRHKSDYLLFYADPGTHLNYALQWFLIAFSITCLSAYKAFRIRRVLKNLPA